ncbi:SDR family oxidoreductase [Vibrio sp. CAIM 722]|uniref:SDR family oxidoreductase n=2 Tax=Vibrio eleionomae TaxID=2653505 RepID=A0A7X4RX12_9VIBR|nr:SDR family oxidoreductase [Vibrio eleionomae]
MYTYELDYYCNRYGYWKIRIFSILTSIKQSNGVVLLGVFMASYKGKRVVITGGTRGIGYQLARKYFDLGAEVIITGTKEVYLGDDSFKYIKLKCNDRKSIDEFINYLSLYGHIDIFINNAGINIINHVDDINISDFDDVIDINLKAPFILSKLVACNYMKEGDKILNIASIWSVITRRGRVSYISSKNGLVGLTKGLATDLAEKGILVNSISPGFVKTELTFNSLSKEEIEELENKIPLGRLAEPIEIANVAAFITSDENSYITGQNIVVDGGFCNV